MAAHDVHPALVAQDDATPLDVDDGHDHHPFASK
jgi:hypothetical protein